MPARKELNEVGSRLVVAAREFLEAVLPDLDDEQQEKLKLATDAGDLRIIVEAAIDSDNPKFKIELSGRAGTKWLMNVYLVDAQRRGGSRMRQAFA